MIHSYQATIIRAMGIKDDHIMMMNLIVNHPKLNIQVKLAIID